MQVKLQENLRELDSLSEGGAIHCTLPPALGSVPASLRPSKGATFASGVQFRARPHTSLALLGQCNACYHFHPVQCMLIMVLQGKG